jgi:DNA-binding NtrC family response regulator
MQARPLVDGQCTESLVGQSQTMVGLRAEIERVASFSTTVLITGPSGTGKELVARQIHASSPRRNQPFIPVDCASMSGELMCSQLFGHVVGAFTGANYEALGCFRAANRGTLFLDEIGELEYSLQAKLLRVLQEHVVTPVGTHHGQRIDVRVVAATNRNLRLDVAEGRFREDLYYRLDVVHLRTTALCQRPEDIALLAGRFLRQLASEGLPARSLSREGEEVLATYDWPGNVRQLRNVLEQAAIDSVGELISGALLRRIISLSDRSDSPRQPAARAAYAALEAHDDSNPSADERGGGNSTWQTLENLEREHISRTLTHTFSNRSAAARLLGVTRQSLLRKMKRYGLEADGKHRKPK